MKHKSFFASMAAIVMFGALGLKLYNQHSFSAPVNDIILANLEALLDSENTSGGLIDGEKDGGFEYPNGDAIAMDCNVLLEKGYFRDILCKVKVIVCEGGGSGCNPKKCPKHPA
ncbi:MAG: hypothetical protein HDS04_01120 [Bacteroides sp.]|nr:hypothetical protein [Bacteroides sp.]